MIPAQLEKLRKDSRKLDNCIHRMKKKGRNDIASRLQIKKAHIDSCIESIIEEEVHPQHSRHCLSSNSMVPVHCLWNKVKCANRHAGNWTRGKL